MGDEKDKLTDAPATSDLRSSGGRLKPVSLPEQPKYKKTADIHDPALHQAFHQMDTNGYTGHDELTEQNQKRFNKTAMAYMYHITSGGHEQCIAEDIECAYWVGLVHAYLQVITT